MSIHKAAWDMVGWDDGEFRIKGGRAKYQAVMFDCSTQGNKVMVARIECGHEGIRQISRYIDGETMLEFSSSDYAEWELDQ